MLDGVYEIDWDVLIREVKDRIIECVKQRRYKRMQRLSEIMYEFKSEQKYGSK